MILMMVGALIFFLGAVTGAGLLLLIAYTKNVSEDDDG